MPHVVFIHGLANKPAPEILHDIWRRKLAHNGGIELGDHGVTSELVYWANALYPAPDPNVANYESQAAAPELGAALSSNESVPDAVVADKPKMQRLMTALGVDSLQDDPAEVAAIDAETAALIALERIPMPEFLRKRLMKKLARDAYLYFYNEEFAARPGESYKVRDELRGRFVKHLREMRDKTDRLVIVSHSMGTMIAYDCLACVDDCPPVDGLMTVGSPLGLDEIQDFWTGWTRADGFPKKKLSGRWVNVYDRLDVVSGADPRLASDYRLAGADRVEDIEEENWGTWRHSISKYLQGKQLRTALADMLKIDWP